MFDSLFQQPALWFSVPALAGTAIFLLRLALMLFGGDSSDGGLDLDADFDLGDGGDHLDPGHSF
ncbi:MAG: hypothetical protein H8E31_00600, partial [Planctomycetes bacterium]|nr:hypothetical protein [Planctomycetota bacterium]